MVESYIKRILTARVYEVASESPLDSAPRLSRRLDNEILLKREDLQQVFSFKLRGAYNKLYQLRQQGALPGVIASSAGNHAQGVALAGLKQGIPATIVMPRTTPQIKVTAVRALEAEVILHGDAYDDAYAEACRVAAERELTFMHPYDDPDVIAGQGTIGVEILRQQRRPIDAVFIPVGGGGLIAGVAAYVKYLSPKTKVIGVEPDDAGSLHAALAADERVVLPQVGLFADGVAVKQVGEETFKIARECVDEVILVDSDEICAAIKDLFEETRTVAEPAGALATAGLKRYVAKYGLRGQSLVSIVSGANMNFDRLRHIAERAELGEQREALFAVTIPERPGAFRAFCEAIGPRGITEFNYRYADDDRAQVFAGIQLTNGESERQQIIELLAERGYTVVDMSDNEMAKLHMRHMVGGHAAGAVNERLFRFEFPERPGALLRFLSRLGERWNISLFHYRSHGAAFGRVLAGIQVPSAERSALQGFLDELEYDVVDESDNPAYQIFLR